MQMSISSYPMYTQPLPTNYFYISLADRRGPEDDPGKALAITNEQINGGSWQWGAAKWDSQSGN